jgi:glutamine synthetase
MRKEGGLRHIMDAIDRLRESHPRVMGLYGDNEKRLTAQSMSEFTSGVADRSASIRISKEVFEKGRGYLEDRRPSSNADPFVVSSLIVESVCLNSHVQEKELFSYGTVQVRGATASA